MDILLCGWVGWDVMDIRMDWCEVCVSLSEPCPVSCTSLSSSDINSLSQSINKNNLFWAMIGENKQKSDKSRVLVDVNLKAGKVWGRLAHLLKGAFWANVNHKAAKVLSETNAPVCLTLWQLYDWCSPKMPDSRQDF